MFTISHSDSYSSIKSSVNIVQEIWNQLDSKWLLSAGGFINEQFFFRGRLFN